MKTLTIIAAILLSSTLHAQKAAKVTGLNVNYKGHQLLRVVGKESELSKTEMAPRKERQPSPTEYTFVDYNKMTYHQMAILPNNDTITVETPFEYNKNLKVIRTEQFLGRECTVAQTSVNSNTIEIWYTNNLGFNGTPMPAWGIPNGLVLKVVRNGSATFEAESINQTTYKNTLLPHSWGKIMDAADYRYELNNSVVKTVTVFDNDTIKFVGGKTPDSFDKDQYLYRVGGGTVIIKRVKLPDNVDGQSIFAQVSQYAIGDAYDRTGSIFVIPTGKQKSYIDAIKSLKNVPSFHSGDNQYPALISTAQYDVPVELMRFFTPFGVRGFNHIKVKEQNWADSIIYKSDVTHLAPLLNGEVWIGAYIGNWDSKGHSISLKIKYHPGGRASSAKVIIPLFNTLNILEQAGQGYPAFFDKDSMRVEFNLEQGLKNAQLAYLTTGHGGWGGGDEFNQKLNTIYLDDNKIFSFIPWREDCASYRNSNPASGNFSNGLSSSDLSRSNWCPGTITNPIYVPLGTLKSGTHRMSVRIPLGKPDGNSFSYWCISGFIIAEKE